MRNRLCQNQGQTQERSETNPVSLFFQVPLFNLVVYNRIFKAGTAGPKIVRSKTDTTDPSRAETCKRIELPTVKLSMTLSILPALSFRKQLSVRPRRTSLRADKTTSELNLSHRGQPLPVKAQAFEKISPTAQPSERRSDKLLPHVKMSKIETLLPNRPSPNTERELRARENS